jgi:hypothetical protein
LFPSSCLFLPCWAPGTCVQNVKDKKLIYDWRTSDFSNNDKGSSLEVTFTKEKKGMMRWMVEEWNEKMSLSELVFRSYCVVYRFLRICLIYFCLCIVFTPHLVSVSVIVFTPQLVSDY